MNEGEQLRQLPLSPLDGAERPQHREAEPAQHEPGPLISLTAALPDQIADYLAHLARLGRARHSTEATRRDLGQLSIFLGGRSIDVVGEADLQAAVEALRDERGNSPASLRRKVASIKAFFRYLQRNQRLAVDPSAALIYPELVEREAEPLSPAELQRLLDEPFVAGHQALILLMADAGLKREEALALQRQDVVIGKVGRSHLIVSRALAAQRVRARTVPLTPRLEAALQALPSDQPADGPLLTLSTRGVDFVMREAGRRAGVPTRGKLTPQRLRDTFAVSWLVDRLPAELAIEDETARRAVAAHHDAELAELLGLARTTLAVGRYRRATRLEHDRAEAVLLTNL